MENRSGEFSGELSSGIGIPVAVPVVVDRVVVLVPNTEEERNLPLARKDCAQHRTHCMRFLGNSYFCFFSMKIKCFTF